MDYEKAKEIKAISDEIRHIDEIIKNIKKQKENIGDRDSLLINCQDKEGFSLETVAIPSEDARHALLLVQSFYIKKRSRILQKIEQI